VTALGQDAPRACPCGSGESYAACCGPLHTGEAAAETAKQMMRSRFSAFVLRDEAYLLRTWHPRTRPERVRFDELPTWLGLSVVATADGREGESVGEVEFEAAYVGGVLHERSRFSRRAGRWVYVDGDILS